MHRGMFRRPVGMLPTPLERAMAPREGSELGMFAAGPMVVATPLTALPAMTLSSGVHMATGVVTGVVPSVQAVTV